MTTLSYTHSYVNYIKYKSKIGCALALVNCYHSNNILYTCISIMQSSSKLKKRLTATLLNILSPLQLINMRTEWVIVTVLLNLLKVTYAWIFIKNYRLFKNDRIENYRLLNEDTQASTLKMTINIFQKIIYFLTVTKGWTMMQPPVYGTSQSCSKQAFHSGNMRSHDTNQ